MSRPTTIDHVQLTVPRDVEAEAIAFYSDIIGLQRIDKPAALAKRGGAWYQVGPVQFHLSPETQDTDLNTASKRHVCFMVDDLAVAQARIEGAGGVIIPDKQPLEGFIRFYMRDPGGNRVELAQRVDT